MAAAAASTTTSQSPPSSSPTPAPITPSASVTDHRGRAWPLEMIRFSRLVASTRSTSPATRSRIRWSTSVTSP